MTALALFASRPSRQPRPGETYRAFRKSQYVNDKSHQVKEIIATHGVGWPSAESATVAGMTVLGQIPNQIPSCAFSGPFRAS